MQWIAPHLRNEKGPVATCYPYASSSCPSSQFFARRAGISPWKLPARVTAAHSRDQSTLISLPLFKLRPVFHRRERASLILSSRHFSRVSSRDSPSILCLAVCFRVPSVSYRARHVRSCDRIDKNARYNLVYLGYSKRRASNKGKNVEVADAFGASMRAVSRGGNSRRPDSRQLIAASNARCRNAPFMHGMVAGHGANGSANRLFTLARRPNPIDCEIQREIDPTSNYPGAKYMSRCCGSFKLVYRFTYVRFGRRFKFSKMKIFGRPWLHYT